MSSDDDFSYADDPELIEQFVGWTSEAVEELKILVENFPEAEFKTGTSATRIYDLTHNIKGMGASFNFPLMSHTGTSLCAYIKSRSDAEPLSKRVVEAHVKVFDVVLSNKIQGDGGEKGEAIQQRLAAIVAEEAS